jgi:hypothetical protein
MAYLEAGLGSAAAGAVRSWEVSALGAVRCTYRLSVLASKDATQTMNATAASVAAKVVKLLGEGARTWPRVDRADRVVGRLARPGSTESSARRSGAAAGKSGLK